MTGDNSTMKRLLQKHLPLSIRHIYKIYKYNFSTINEYTPLNVLQNIASTTRKLVHNRKKILFYPDGIESNPRVIIYQLCLFLGYAITNNPKEQVDICIKWKDATFSPKDQVLLNLSKRGTPVINIDCEDISKSRVHQVFYSVFGYSADVDPLTHQGNCVVKSDLNSQHYAEVISCPRSTVIPNVVYCKLINNEIEDGVVLHYRVPIFKHLIPLVYVKRMPLDDRFGGFSDLISVQLVSAEEVFSKVEIHKILSFCHEMNLDYGELDVLRDQDDGQLYIVDANHTPCSKLLTDLRRFPPDRRVLSPSDRLTTLEKLAKAFNEALLSS